jgi:hypothetical protein
MGEFVARHMPERRVGDWDTQWLQLAVQRQCSADAYPCRASCDEQTGLAFIVIGLADPWLLRAVI